MLAQRIQRDPSSLATTFQVFDTETFIDVDTDDLRIESQYGFADLGRLLTFDECEALGLDGTGRTHP